MLNCENERIATPLIRELKVADELGFLIATLQSSRIETTQATY